MKLRRLRTRFDIKGWYQGIKDRGDLVAWCSAFAPVEALMACGVTPVFPENHAAMMGALSPKRDPNKPYALSAIGMAEFVGYSYPSLCSYALADIGSLIDHYASPIGGLPAPDLFYACDSQCSVVGRWAATMSQRAERYGEDLPYYVLKAPPLTKSESHSDAEIDTFEGELRGHIKDIEARYSVRFDEDRLAEIVAESTKANDLWQACLGLASRSPTPWSNIDAWQAMAPIVIARGTKQCTEFYAMLLAELQQRTYHKVQAIPDERVRLMWDAIPIWPRKNWLSQFCAQRGAVFTASTYTHSWWFEFDPAEAMRSLCRRYAWNTMNRSGKWVLDWTLDLYRYYKCDGMICHWNRTCGIWNSYVKRRLKGYEAAGIPTLVIEADMVDARYFDEQRVSADLDAFITSIVDNKVTS